MRLTLLEVAGKGSKTRRVMLAGRASDDLHAWLDAAAPDPGAPLFGLASGNAVWKAIDRLGRRAGVARFSPHDLRRTFISMSLAVGVDLATVQAAAGHADPRTTSRYDRRGVDALRQAAISLAQGAGWQMLACTNTPTSCTVGVRGKNRAEETQGGDQGGWRSMGGGAALPARPEAGEVRDDHADTRCRPAPRASEPRRPDLRTH